MRRMVGDKVVKATMTGVGSSARQSYPRVTYESISVNLSNIYDISKISMSGFDVRTGSTSKYLGNSAFGGRLSPQGNEVPTYQYRLNDRIFDGVSMAIETIIAPQPKTLALPSSLILAGDWSTGNLVAAEFGSNGVRLISLSPSGLIYEYLINVGLPAGALLRVERFLSYITVYVNGTRVGSATHPSFNMQGSPGIGTYSHRAPDLSTPVGPTTFFGGTSLPRVRKGREYWEKTMLPLETPTEICRMYIQEAGRYRLAGNNVRWVNSTAFSGRNWSLRLNGTQVANWNEQNGTNTLPTTRDVPANSVVTMVADSNAGDNDRLVQTGHLSYDQVV